MGVSDRVLNKPGPLTPEEAVEMRSHPELGRDVIVRAEARVGVRDDVTLQIAKDIVYTHHERWDGTGYPQGLRGTDIPIPGRIMAVVDVYDAVRARSLYSACRSHEETVDLIVAGKHSHFDPDVVDAFLRVSASFEAVSSESLGDAASGRVVGQEQPRLAGADDVHVAVAVDVAHRHLKPAAGLAAVVDRVARPRHGVVRARRELVPIDAQRIVVAGRAARCAPGIASRTPGRAGRRR